MTPYLLYICLLYTSRAVKDPRGFGEQEIEIDDDMLAAIAEFANGDARSALSTLEMAVLNGEVNDNKVIVTKENLEQCTSRKSLLYDKKGEEHYNLISALHKSMRNSDPDAAVYWLARMLEAGEDPLYIARRVTRFEMCIRDRIRSGTIGNITLEKAHRDE